MRRILLPSTLIFLGLLMLVVISELVLRVTNYEKNELQWINDGMIFFNLHPKRTYFLNSDAHFPMDKPNSEFYKTDNLGFRYNPQHDINQQSQISIIMVGDSMTYGPGVENRNTYPAIVERLLKEEGINAVVHNAGVPGYSPDQEFLYIKELIPKYKPNIIVWNLNANDVEDSNVNCLFKEGNGKFNQISGKQNIVYIQGFLIKHTYRFFKNSDLYNLILNIPSNVTRRERYTLGCTHSVESSRKELYEEFKKKMNYFISDLNKITKEKNIQLLLIHVPFQYYFIPEKDEINLVEDYRLIKETILSGGNELLDANEEIRFNKSNYLALEKEEVYNDSEMNSADQVLGTVVEDLSTALFLDEDNIDGSHLNEAGNKLFARLVHAELVRILTND